MPWIDRRLFPENDGGESYFRVTWKVARYRPAWVAVLGVGAYRAGFGRPDARLGRQPERLGPAGLWLLPNPSGLNAHHQLRDLAVAFAELRRAARRPLLPRSSRAG